MENKKLLFIILFSIIIILLGMYFLYRPSNDNIVLPHEKVHSFSKDIVYDGDHHKINHKIISEKDHIYIALPDLQFILSAEVKQQTDKLSITYGSNQLLYQNTVIQTDNLKENEINKYLLQDNVIYIPDTHIEKYLGVEVDYLYDSKTGTIALFSPNEQQKKSSDQGIGSTIFLHKKNVPLSKYEPRNGIYLGGYVIQDEFIDTSMEKFNQVTRKQHASYFRYVGYGQAFPTEWVNEVIAQGGFPQIAWEPNNGLEEVVDNTYLREFARDAARVNVPILLRYASEMNGNWTAYSGNPELYIEKWRLIHDIMEKEAPNVMMLWNVFTMPEQTIDDYYPGDDYVDYVGVNIYNVYYHNDRLEDRSDFEDPLRLLDYVYNRYSDTKPIVIGEYGATNYTVTDGLYHVDFAVDKINRMYKYLKILYPRVKFIYYFDVNNLVNAPEGRKINNYAITENKRITNAYASNVEDEWYLSEIDTNATQEETFSYRDFLFYYHEELYVDIDYIQSYLGLKVQKNNHQSYEITHNGKSMITQKEELQIDKAAFFEKRNINGVAIEEILNTFDIPYQYLDKDLHIYL